MSLQISVLMHLKDCRANDPDFFFPVKHLFMDVDNNTAISILEELAQDELIDFDAQNLTGRLTQQGWNFIFQKMALGDGKDFWEYRRQHPVPFSPNKN